MINGMTLYISNIDTDNNDEREDDVSANNHNNN